MDKNCNELAFTGERFIPGIDNSELEIEHYQRYYSVLPLVKGKVVVDAACGEGYGTNLISKVAQTVTGIDISKEAVEHAKEKYGKENTTFLCESIENISLPDKSVDVFVSFETLEHVGEDVQKKFLSQVKRVLKPEGKLIISTPNKKIYSDKYDFHNKFHVHEFYYDEFESFVKGFFKYVNIYHQMFEVASVIDSKNDNKDVIGYKREDKYQFDGKYYIAIASDMPIGNVKYGHTYLYNSNEYTRIVDRIIVLQDEENERNKHIKKLTEEIDKERSDFENLRNDWDEKCKYVDFLQKEEQKKEEQIQNLREDWEAKCNHVEILKKEEKKKDEQIKNLREDWEAKCNHIEILLKENEGLSGRIDHLDVLVADIEGQREALRSELANNIVQLEDRTKDLERVKEDLVHSEGHVKALEDVVDQRNATISELQNKVAALGNENDRLAFIRDQYYHEMTTKSYKIGKGCQKAFDTILPPASARRFNVRILYNCIKQPKVMKIVLGSANKKNLKQSFKKGGIGEVVSKYEILLKDAKEEITNKETTEKIVFNEVKNPLVSIIIPVYNQWSYTYRCLKSILENSGDVSYEIIIADDCSTDLTRDITSIVKGIRVVRTTNNLRFLLNCNNAAKSARGEFIVFLNNDTQVKPDWLNTLVDTFNSHEDAGIVGSKLIYPDGKLQEAGGIIWNDASAWNYGNSQDAEASEFNYLKEVDYISGAAIMIRKKLWEEIGGFDTQFAPAYCEDSDLAFEVRKRGYKVIYQPLSVVVHFEGVSNGTDVTTGLKKYQIENAGKFLTKWQNELQKNHFANGEKVFLARDRSKERKCVLFIDHYVPQYDKDAGSRTVFAYLKLLAKKGYNVKFIGDNFYRHEPYTTTLQQLGIEVLYGPYYAASWEKWVNDNAEYIDYVFLNRPHISVKYMDFIKESTHARVIYYGHDLHYLRFTREYELTGEKETYELAQKHREQEYDLMMKADVVYYPSSIEVDEIMKTNSVINAKVLSPYIMTDIEEKEFDTMRREGLLFVGGFAHGPNVDAVKWFCKEVLPIAIKKLPHIRFDIVGSNPTNEVKKLASKNVIIHGYVDDDELNAIYDNCRMAVIPLRYGAGIKGKVVEAMSKGVPVITTSCGAEGIIDSERILMIEDEPKKMAERIIAAYSDVELLKKLSEESYEYIRNYYSEDIAWDCIKDELK